MPSAMKPAFGLDSKVVAMAWAASRRFSGSSAMAFCTSAVAMGSSRSNRAGSISVSDELVFSAGLEQGQGFGVFLEKHGEVGERSSASFCTMLVTDDWPTLSDWAMSATCAVPLLSMSSWMRSR